jgi:putative resolvase
VIILKFYDLDEIAKILGTSTETIRRYVRSGKLKAIKIGRDYKVSEENLQKMIKDNET